MQGDSVDRSVLLSLLPCPHTKGLYLGRKEVQNGRREILVPSQLWNKWNSSNLLPTVLNSLPIWINFCYPIKNTIFSIISYFGEVVYLNSGIYMSISYQWTVTTIEPVNVIRNNMYFLKSIDNLSLCPGTSREFLFL